MVRVCSVFRCLYFFLCVFLLLCIFASVCFYFPVLVPLVACTPECKAEACAALSVHVLFMHQPPTAPPSGKDRVEIMLALGATRMEAARSVLQRALLVALTPVLNQLSVVGIVSIPGMMTGQILVREG